MMTKKPNMVTVSFMVLVTFFIMMFAYLMPDYYGETLKMGFFVLGLVSAVKTFTMTVK